MPHPLRAVGAMLIALSAAALNAATGSAALAAPHRFVLTYRDFGPVEVDSAFQPGIGYEVRAEGCYARHSDEAICGFTLRAKRPLTVTNLANASHGSGADSSAIRTCCMFVQGDDRGYPISQKTAAPGGLGVLSRPLSPGQQVGLMLRVPNYRTRAPLAAITFSHGEGDQGTSFPQHVVELP